jgi:septation ring formation regulator EzrA
MISVKKVIDRLNDSPAKITQKLTTLNEEREQLLSKLKDVEASIRLEEDNLVRIPTTLSEQKRKCHNSNLISKVLKPRRRTQC